MSTRPGSILRNGFAIAVLFLIVVLGLIVAPTQNGRRQQPEGSTNNLQSTIHNPQSEVPPVFGPNVRANSDSTLFGQHEPSLAVSRTNPDVVVAASKDYRDGNVKHVWIDVSTD